MRTSSALVVASIVTALASSVSAAESEWQSLLGDIDPVQDAVEGEWTKSENALSVVAAQGTRLALPVAPTGE
jgi:hypothetical protein